ncbi:MAG: hypothetical protein PHD11_03535 [Bacteroidales bacterium]|nr:hypothetical protein [Bacteroidales bacterium]MDD4669809.1 hypothetical protein [Bacteroidales bacterium]
MDRLCPECGSKVVGRRDKIFCSDMCRNYYHNKVRYRKESPIRNINNILMRNRRILESYSLKGLNALSVTALNEDLFNFDYCTSTEMHRFGRRCYYCYDYRYYISPKRIVHFGKTKEIKHQSYQKYSYL